MAFAAQAQAQVKGSLNGQRDAIIRLAADTGSSPDVSIHPATGAARFVRVAPGWSLSAQSRGRAITDVAKQSGSVQFLADYASLFGIANASAELGTGKVEKDRHGGTHLTHKQLYQGLPVFGAELKTHFDASNNLVAANGTFIPGITVNSTPSRSAEQASKTAMALVKADHGQAKNLMTSSPTLMIYREGLAKGVEGANHLAWQVVVGNRVDVREFVYVDAHSGKVIDTITGIHDAKNRRAYDGLGVNPAPGPNYPASPFWVEGNSFPTGTIEADNMIAASSEIYDLFKNAFGRDSFNGAGATMDSIFNRGNGCPNASWNGLFISFCPGTTTDDVTAHEWGHAYTEYTDNLIYAWQPGALNEAYSDIWGETVDRLNGRGGDSPNAARTAGSCTVSTKVTQTTITAPAAIAGVKISGSVTFGPQTFSLSGNAAGVEIGSTQAACNPLVANSLTGMIAFIDRGTCAATIKVKNAQVAGAIGVVIGNNTGGTVAPNFSGADASITIPTLTVSQNDGTAIKAQLGATVTVSLVRGPGSDNSVRWLMGEDSVAFGGAIRDMYNPTCMGNPGKVSDAQYVCSTADSGGVHGNSGVPNHGYALLVDGGTYNGQSITAIGLTKAAHIYYRAQSVYQGPATSFAEHADALQQSCTDLTGVNLKDLLTGAASGEIINATDCTQVAKMALAVELRTPPTQCNFQPLLAKSPPALCAAGSPSSLLADNFDGGKRGGVKWLVSNIGNNPEFTARNWGVVSGLPGQRAGYAMFAADANIGSCAPGDNQAGLQRLESPEITLPANATRLTFDHYVATEAAYDGGNVKISVNGGAWTVVPAAAFVYNAYNTTMATGAQGSDSPLAGQPGFSGTDTGSVGGSLGRSIVSFSGIANAGDKVKLRFEMGNDGCGGVKGWYLDDVMVYSCPTPAP